MLDSKAAKFQGFNLRIEILIVDSPAASGGAGAIS